MEEPGQEPEAVQLPLIAGWYKCDDCGQYVERLYKNRRFRLCKACHKRVVPVLPEGRIQPGSPEQEAMSAYWGWYEEMDRRVPRRREAGYAARTRQPSALDRPTDDYYPLCACGQPRATYTHVVEAGAAPRGLFGGPFAHECETCELKRRIELHFGAATTWMHPEWDDETHLDFLMSIMPEAFALRLLPDYWYELRRAAVTKSRQDQNGYS